ncbi:MAG: response regulator [Chitinophagaceae bacterium]
MNYEKRLMIFVVEDNPIYQQLISRQLEPLSYALRLFAKGEDCLEGLKKSMPDMIVMDNSLDGELTGLQTVQQIRKTDSNLYILVFSTEPGLDSPENIKLYGNFDYVEKKETAFALLRDKVADSRIYMVKSNIEFVAAK